jgi:hypothetical protein
VKALGNKWCHNYLALDPDVELIRAKKFRKFADEKGAPLMLGVDASLIAKGPVKQITDRVRTYIEQAGEKGRLLMMLNDIPRDTAPEHIHAAVRATRMYASYPFKKNQFNKPFKMPRIMSFS